MAEIINAIKERKVLLTGKDDIVRDYIGSEDLFSLVCCCIKKKMNGAYDIYSRKPVRKFEILENFQKRFGLDYKISKANKFLSSTGSKNIYCSKNKKVRKLGYVPKYNSLELLIKETEELLSKRGGW
jgi:nucleoside-diphosphate-sugar epimerase